MGDKPREFETDVSVTMSEALQIIRAALDDEDLALGPSSLKNDGVTSVIVRGRKVFRVPASRIYSKEEDAIMRAAFEADAARQRKEAHL